MPAAGALDAIVTALAPAAGLTSGIFLANGLAVRFGQISSRVRELNREARTLTDGDRLASVRRQVDLLVRRAHLVQRSILVAFAGLFALILTILALLLDSFFELRTPPALAFGAFSVGLLLFGAALVISFTELSLSTRTLNEDVRTSFPKQ